MFMGSFSDFYRMREVWKDYKAINVLIFGIDFEASNYRIIVVANAVGLR